VEFNSFSGVFTFESTYAHGYVDFMIAHVNIPFFRRAGSMTLGLRRNFKIGPFFFLKFFFFFLVIRIFFFGTV
jgi:hypothetical protein